MHGHIGIFVFTLLVLLTPAVCMDSELMGLLNSYEDPLMTSLDLAFLLVTHGLDATPANGYVVVVAGNATYTLIPNGDKPGLAEVYIDAPDAMG
ncbi:MAG: hypothetical protein H5T42_07730 [Methanothrix sp.]|nr:hypothetical protein [Methanothrix sp.]NPU87628.1 hypothetical protein [Methanothrix sp.]